MRIGDRGDELDLTYCGNVHASASLADLHANLRAFAGPLARRLDPGGHRGPAACGLYFGATLAEELHRSATERRRLADTLEAEGLFALTVNAFPHGAFHADRVKRAVYEPDWTDPERLRYTLAIAEILAELPGAERARSISTLPGAYGPLEGERRRAAIENLRLAGRALGALEAEHGTTIRLAIEPEPGCAFERIEQILDFLEEELFADPEAELLRRHIGVCLDVCHQAVEFEDLTRTLDAILERQVALPKIQVSSALALREPARDPAALAALARFDEPRYLHQVFARRRDGALDYFEDLGPFLAAAVDRDDLEARCHFHVPVHRERYGALATTRPQLVALLDRVRERGVATQLEVETYTWEVLPREIDGPAPSLLDDLELELAWVRARFERA